MTVAFIGPAADTRLTGVQLEPGPVASPWEARPIQTELALCQRYFYKNISGQSFTRFAVGFAGSNVGIAVTLKHPVRMRAFPTFEASGPGTFQVSDQVSGQPTTGFLSLIANVQGLDQANVSVPCGGALTQFRPYFLEASNSTTAFYQFDAEL